MLTLALINTYFYLFLLHFGGIFIGFQPFGEVQKLRRFCQKQVPIFVAFHLPYDHPPPSPLGATSFMDVPLLQIGFLDLCKYLYEFKWSLLVVLSQNFCGINLVQL